MVGKDTGAIVLKNSTAFTASKSDGRSSSSIDLIITILQQVVFNYVELSQFYSRVSCGQLGYGLFVCLGVKGASMAKVSLRPQLGYGKLQGINLCGIDPGVPPGRTEGNRNLTGVNGIAIS